MIDTILITIVIVALIPFFMRWAFAFIGIAAVFVIVGAARAEAQNTRTTCYDSGPTRICDTFDNMGNIISKSRCYKSGNDTRCDTQSFSGTPTAPLIPNGGRPQR
jgi:hypothetical protein